MLFSSDFQSGSKQSLRTIASNPAISNGFLDLLYTQDPIGLHKFHKTMQRTPLKTVLENPAIACLLTQHEPGPRVDYDSLSAGLATLDEELVRRNFGSRAITDIIRFFQDGLLTIRQQWLSAAAEHYSFAAYWKMLTLNNISFVSTAFEQHQRLTSSILQSAESKLIALKMSNEMWTRAGLLWHLLDEARKLSSARNWHAQRESQLLAQKLQAEDAQKRRDEAKRENEMLMAMQMGQHNRDPMDAEVERRLIGFLEEQAELVQKQAEQTDELEHGGAGARDDRVAVGYEKGWEVQEAVVAVGEY